MADHVVVAPTTNADEFGVSLGPAILADAIAGDIEPVVIDLSSVTSADQRYAIASSADGPLFRVNTSERYTLTAAGNPLIGELSRGVFGYQSYDVDQFAIDTIHVARHSLAADTSLVEELAAGDTSFLIADASGWSNDSTQSAETRSLAWYGYTDSTGFTYPDYTYTRNVALDSDEGLWAAGQIWFDASAGAYRVPLNAPWAGPTIAVGTAVRNATSGPALDEPFPSSLINSPVRWPQLSATIGGEWQNGLHDALSFRPGTAYIQVVSSVDASIWNSIAIGPEQDFPGALQATISATGTNTIVLDLDVLSKHVSSFTGDFNQDGAIDAADFVMWRKSAGSEAHVPFSGADANGDGGVDDLDYQKWRANYGANVSIAVDSATAAHGTATIVGGAEEQVIHFESEPWFVGTDIIDYTLRDVTTGSTYSTQLVVEVLGSNYSQDPLVAATLDAQSQVVTGNVVPLILGDIFYNTAEGQQLSAGGLLEPFSDPSDELVVRLLSGPAHGSLSVAYDGTFEYTPADGFVGVDTFRYEAFDGRHAATGLASIDVLPAGEVVTSRLRDIGIAMLNYESVHNRFPIANDAALFDANGVPFLSWRVHLLPFFGLQSLYDQFHLDEPWDSPHNLQLLDEMPNEYRSPGDVPGGATTRFQTLTGPDAPFGNRPIGTDQTGPRWLDFQDDVQHTILVIESASDAAVPWTKPDDLDFQVANPLAALGTISGDIRAVMADGSTLVLPAEIGAETFKALVTINGNEIVDAHTLRREYQQSNPGPQPTPVFGEKEGDAYFKALAISAHAYLEARGRFPIVGSSNFDEQGNPYLSWRVHLLPYLGYRNLYERFNLTEPWDSPNNLALLPEMPDMFRSAADAADTMMTRVQTFTGPDAPFGFRTPGSDQLGPRNTELSDGFSNTILFVEAAANQAVLWTKPDDLEFDRNAPLVGIDVSEKIRTVLFDIKLATLRPDIPAAAFTALVTRIGGESVSASSFAYTSSGDFKSPLQRQNDLKEIATAMLYYADAHLRHAVNRLDAEGSPLLSWRVMLLPFLEQDNLYSQFNLNEPWDSPHNLSLLEFMPDVYRSIGDSPDSVATRVMHFTGPGAPFPSAESSSELGPRWQDISDGTSRTIAFIEAGPENAVPWTKPVDVPLYSNNPFSPLGELGEEFLGGFFDTHIEVLSALLSPGDLKARITHQGGENTNVPNPIVTNAGVFVIETGGDTKSNEFGADVFYVVLDRKPNTQVVIELETSDETVAVLDKSELIFTPDTWYIPQQVVVRGVDNQVVNADRTIQITVSVVDALSDSDYHTVPEIDFAVTIIDDEVQQPMLPGDYNRDGSVDAGDYVLWRRGSTVEQLPYRGADGNGNGRIDQGDYPIWRSNFGAELSTGAAFAAAPEAQSMLSTVRSFPIGETMMADDVGRRMHHSSISARLLGDGATIVDSVFKLQWPSITSKQQDSNGHLLVLANISIDDPKLAEAKDGDAIDAALSDEVDEHEICEPVLATLVRALLK